MNDDVTNMTCADFQAHLPELIASGEDINDHPHLQDCELCRALLADLETIAEAARLLFPIEEPPDDLWDHIESAIKSEKSSPDSETSKADGAGESNPGLSTEPA
jgi:hypothetical protein